MKKYFLEFSIHVQRHLMYRARLVIWFFVDILHVFIMPFLWLSIYAGRDEIGGFSEADIVTYYVLTLIVGLIAKSHIRRMVQQDVLKGDLTNILLKPVSYLLFKPMRELSYKFNLFFITIPIVLLCYFFLPDYFTLPENPLTWLWFALSAVLAFGISACQQLTMGLLSFWIGETKSIDAFWQMAFYVFSGEIAPLALLPAGAQTLAAFLPFQYIISSPVTIFLEQQTTTEMLFSLLYATLWLVFFWLILQFVWKKGIKTYEGGGI